MKSKSSSTPQEYIPSDDMYKFIDCRYTGVVVTARRARQLMMEDPANARGKPLLRAFDDLMQGKLHYQFVEPLEYEEEYGEGVYYPQEEDVPEPQVEAPKQRRKGD